MEGPIATGKGTSPVAVAPDVRQFRAKPAARAPGPFPAGLHPGI